MYKFIENKEQLAKYGVTDDALANGANTTTFTTATANAGQYTTFTEQYTPS